METGTKRVTIGISATLLEQAEAAAREDGIPLDELVRRLVIRDAGSSASHPNKDFPQPHDNLI